LILQFVELLAAPEQQAGDAEERRVGCGRCSDCDAKILLYAANLDDIEGPSQPEGKVVDPDGVDLAIGFLRTSGAVPLKVSIWLESKNRDAIELLGHLNIRD
jgi:hypothetical protein